MFLQALSLLLVTVLSFSSACRSAWALPDESAGDYVILLHGLGRTHRSMHALEERLAGEGFQVINLDYPSRQYSIEQLAGILKQRIEQNCTAEEKRIHFVTHSMGGMILRSYVQQNRPERLGRVVMLCPPGSGSELVDIAGANWLFEWLNGPAGSQLGTDSSSFPQRLGPVDFELGVIAGDKSLNPLYSLLIPGKDDGKVSVDRAKVAGMADFLVLPHSHTFIMSSPETAKQVVYFLRNGRFLKNGGEGK